MPAFFFTFLCDVVTRMITFRQPAAVLLAFASVVIVAVFVGYFPGLSAPFYLDDRVSIVENQAFAKHDVLLLWQLFGSRFIGYFSLYLNYLVSPENTVFYRITNLIIHFLNGLLLGLLYRRLCQFLKVKAHLWLAVVLIALWLVHPLHSAAVTYIVQRLAALVTFFGLLTLYSYMRFRNDHKKTWLILALLAFAAAVMTKQNAVVLPLMIFVFEWLYGGKRRQLNFILAGCIALILICGWLAPEFSEWLDVRSRETTLYSRWDYFSAQGYVLLLYWAKLLFIYPLQLDMTMPIQSISIEVRYSALVLHALLMLLAAISYKRLPLFTLGVFWFYLLNLVESGVIPIVDLAFEHRAYFPDCALVLALVGLIPLGFGVVHPRIWFLFAIGTLIFSTIKLYQRNELWQQPEQFHLQNISNNPTAAKAMATVGAIYAREGKFTLANDYMTKSFEYQFEQGSISVGTIVNIMKVRFEMKEYQSGVNLAVLGLKSINEPRLRSDLLAAMAVGYINMGYCDFAKGLIQTALSLNPSNSQALLIKDVCN
ncbi:hypothetical protein [Rheinheimera sp.]|uniref:hypothetical protein n=1 Tax=Rheinheimera sp. TaxID=1869214 RepID=UPI00307E49A4